MSTKAAFSLFACLLVADVATAMFLLPPLDNVPVERLIANVREKLKTHPDDKQGHYTLGRLHSMAATGTAKAQAAKADQTPYFGPEPQPAPMRRGVQAAKTPEAKKHLAAAIASYQAALKLGADDLFSLMGLAWCYAQDGQNDKALATYRKAHAIAWKQESGKDSLYHGSSVTVESGEVLLQMLAADDKDRADIKQHIAAINAKPMFITPIILPVDGTARLRDLMGEPGHGVRFDLVGAGQPARWQWVSPRAAFLVWDGDRTGTVKSGRQLFGSTTWWVIWSNGYQPLAALDDDGNGVLEGEELRGLSIWHDRNTNGVCEAGELVSVADWDITGIVCKPATVVEGCPSHPAGIRFRDGSTRPSFDWQSRRLAD